MLKRTGGGRIGYLPARRWGVLRPGRRNTSEIQVRLGFGRHAPLVLLAVLDDRPGDVGHWSAEPVRWDIP